MVSEVTDVPSHESRAGDATIGSHRASVALPVNAGSPGAGGARSRRNLPVVRVGASIGTGEEVCAQRLQAKARVTDRINRPRRAKERLDDFLLKPVFAALDEVELRGMQRSSAVDAATVGTRLDTPELAWIRNAVERFPDFASEGLLPIDGHWVVAGQAGDEVRELYTWGRGYTTHDRRRRVMVLPSFGPVNGRRAEAEKVAIAAFTTAYGVRSGWPDGWWTPFRRSSEKPVVPDRVTVCQVGLLDGSLLELFDGSPEEARTAYDAIGRPAAERARLGGPAVPGRDCSDCALLDKCGSTWRATGLLGVNSPRAPLRRVSATSLRYHVACPRQARLQSIHLSHDIRESPSVTVGRAVDEALNRAHKAGLSEGCSAIALAHELGSVTTLTPDEKSRATALLRQHVDLCPWNSGCKPVGARPQASAVAFDPLASAVVLATPDLVYRDDGELVWRETTTSHSPPSSRRHMFDTRKGVQLALAALLCDAGALGEPVARIEVEYLTDRGADMRYLDPSDPAVIGRARSVIEPLASAWRCDDDFAPTPGAACGSCSFTQWCSVAIEPERTCDA